MVDHRLRRIFALLLCALSSLSCSTEPSGPYLRGVWSSPSLGAVATQAGLRLTMTCGGTGWFDGPLTLDSLNVFSGSGHVQFDAEPRSELIVGRVSTDGLSLQWGPPNRPPDLNGALWFLLPGDVGRPTEDPCATSAPAGASRVPE
jgi:hypothetical protein